MRSKVEIGKRLDSAYRMIINCRKGCASKPPGLYCSMCSLMDQNISILEWVLKIEHKKDKNGSG